MAIMGFRVYRENPQGPHAKTDARGGFEGWSAKFDEIIPVFSPRMTHYGTRSNKKEEDIDLLLQPAAG